MFFLQTGLGFVFMDFLGLCHEMDQSTDVCFVHPLSSLHRAWHYKDLEFSLSKFSGSFLSTIPCQQLC